MSRYLDALKAKIGQTPLPRSPSKPSKPPFEGFEGDQDRHLSPIEVPIGPPDFDEGAALAEIEGRVPAIYARAFAELQGSCPDHVDESRWRRVIDDAGRFLDHWGGQAETLGWSATDLFHPQPPRGLVWCIDLCEVVALTDTSATIRTRSGGALTFRR